MNYYLGKNDFVYEGELYFRMDNGRCYMCRDAKPGSRLAKEGYAAKKRISTSLFEKLLQEVAHE